MAMADNVGWLSLCKCYDFGTMSPTVVNKESRERSGAVIVGVFVE